MFPNTKNGFVEALRDVVSRDFYSHRSLDGIFNHYFPHAIVLLYNITIVD